MGRGRVWVESGGRLANTRSIKGQGKEGAIAKFNRINYKYSGRVGTREDGKLSSLSSGTQNIIPL